MSLSPDMKLLLAVVNGALQRGTKPYVYLQFNFVEMAPRARRYALNAVAEILKRLETLGLVEVVGHDNLKGELIPVYENSEQWLKADDPVRFALDTLTQPGPRRTKKATKKKPALRLVRKQRKQTAK